MSPGFYIGLAIGLAAGAAIALGLAARLFQRVAVHQVNVTPEAIARGIAAGGGIHCTTPAVLVDWSIIHTIVEAQGYRLIAKHELGVPKSH